MPPSEKDHPSKGKNLNVKNWEGKNKKSWGKQLFGIAVVMLTEAAVEIPPWDRIVIMG